MAGDWIKVEHTLPDKPEVVRMASILGIEQDAVAGKLLRCWIWADANSVDGHALTVTSAFIDRHCCCPGFANALREVGWLEGRDAALTFPRFLRHNGQSAKTRALGNDRKQRQRSGPEVSRSGHAGSVTKTGQNRDQRREEKNREENIPPTTLPPTKGDGGVESNPSKEHGFDPFWEAYPKKQSKMEAQRAWANRNCAALSDQIMRALELAKQSQQWLKEGGQYIPHAATWLNQERWNDEVPPRSQQLTNKSSRADLMRPDQASIDYDAGRHLFEP